MPTEPTVEEQWYKMLTEGEPIPVTSIILTDCFPPTRAASYAPRRSKAGADVLCVCSAGTNLDITRASAKNVRCLSIPAAQKSPDNALCRCAGFHEASREDECTRV